jgi:hypothetical protein
MNLQNRLRKPNTLLRVGLAFLAVANVSHYVLVRTAVMSDRLIDPVFGVLTGASIACLLLSISIRTRRCTGDL